MTLKFSLNYAFVFGDEKYEYRLKSLEGEWKYIFITYYLLNEINRTKRLKLIDFEYVPV